MIMDLVFLAVGFVLLLKGSDFFVEDAARIAKKLGISEFIIGLTLVAIGTSFPELAASVSAATKGHGQIIIGNIIGSNIANIALILGISSIMVPIITDETLLKRDGYIMIFVSLLFFGFALTGSIRWWMGVIFLLLYLAYVMFLSKKKEADRKYHFTEFVSYFFKFEYLITIRNNAIKRIRDRRDVKEYHKKIYAAFKEGLVKDFLVAALSLVAIIIGADYLVNSAVSIGRALNISESFIGLSVIAIGTSLPELSVTISAAKKRYGNMSVGNIIGSNIANILLILGVSSTINPIGIEKMALYISAPFMILMSFLLLFFIHKNNHRIGRSEGITFLFLYALFIGVMFFVS